MQFTGTAHKYGRDVDTDVIIPARYLNTSDPAELAKHCMEDLDAGFVGKVEPGDILVAEENFGCGSQPRARADLDQGRGRLGGHRQELRPHLLPQRDQHRAADHGGARGSRRHQRRRQGQGRRRHRGHRERDDRRDVSGAAVPAVREGHHRAGRADRVGPARRWARDAAHRICLLPGDGIGPEITAEAVKVLGVIGAKHGVELRVRRGAARRRGDRRDRHRASRRDARRRRRRPTRCCWPRSAARSGTPPTRPSRGPSRGFSASARRSGCTRTCGRSRSSTRCATPRSLKPEFLEGVDMLIVRELTGGLYFGDRARETGVEGAATGGGAGHARLRHDGRTASTRSSASRASRSRPRARAATRCTASTRPTCSSRAACGARSCTACTPPSTPTSSSSTSSSTTRRCSSSARPRSSTSWSPRTCSATSSPTRRRCSPGRSACSRARRSATARRSTSRATARAPDIAGQGVANPLAMLLSVELMLRYSFEMHDGRRRARGGDRAGARRRLAHARHRQRRHAWRPRRRHGRDGRPGVAGAVRGLGARPAPDDWPQCYDSSSRPRRSASTHVGHSASASGITSSPQ